MTLHDIVHLLRRAGHVHFLNRPATSNELMNCEAELGLRIPNALQEILRFSNGAVLYESPEIIGANKFWEHAETLGETARLLRLSPVHPLKTQAIPFCRDTNDSYFCMDLEGVGAPELTPVFRWTRESGSSDLCYPSFEKWFEDEIYHKYHRHYFTEG